MAAPIWTTTGWGPPEGYELAPKPEEAAERWYHRVGEGANDADIANWVQLPPPPPEGFEASQKPEEAGWYFRSGDVDLNDVPNNWVFIPGAEGAPAAAAVEPTVEIVPGTVADRFTAIPQGVILHGSRSGSGNDTGAEYAGTRNYAASGIELGWNATIGDNIYAVHIECSQWGWNARGASSRWLAVEFAQATADRPISDGQVNAFCHWFKNRARAVWPALPLVFPTHAELPEGKADGKSDVFPLGDPRADELRARILARLGFESEPPAIPAEANVGGFSMEPDHQFNLAELWPTIQAHCARYEVDPRILAGMVMQESTFHNYRVHDDGTGHGLLGYDDNGVLPDFESWAGIQIGRGANAAIIPVEPQLQYAAKQLRAYQDYYADDPELPGRSKEFVGARAWHAGGGYKYTDPRYTETVSRNSPRGARYEEIIKGRIVELGL